MLNLILLSFFACSGGEEAPSQEVTKAEVKTEAPAKPTVNPKPNGYKSKSAILGSARQNAGL